MTLSAHVGPVLPLLAVWGVVGNVVLGLCSSLEEDTPREAIALLTQGSGHGTGTAKGGDGIYHPKLKNAVSEEPSYYVEALGCRALLG